MHCKYETHYLIFYAKFESTPILKAVRVLVRIPVSMYILTAIGRQRNAIGMAFCWRADSGPRLDAGLDVPMRSLGLARLIEISVNRSIYKRKPIIDMKIQKSVTFNGCSVYLFN